MGSAYVPKAAVENVYIGNTTVTNPMLILTIGTMSYPNGYFTTDRNYFITYDSGTGNIYLTCRTIASSADSAAVTLTDVGVLVIG